MSKDKAEKLILPNEGSVTFSAKSADKLIQAADPLAALLYIYILRNGGEMTLSGAARALCVTENEIAAAMNTLTRTGLVRKQEPREPVHLQEDKLPSYTTADIARELSGDGEFQGLLAAVQEQLGTKLSSNDVEKLIGIRRELGFPPEVILLLVSYCINENSRRFGPGRRPTMRYIEKVAFTWESEGIMTLEGAEEYIKRREARRGALGRIKSALQILDRELSPTERRYVEAWLDLGFDPDAIELAYDKTVLKTGRRTWAYMNSILNSWHDMGLHTADQVLARQQAKTVKQGPARKTEAASAEDELEHMRRLLKELKGSEE
ncbi:MAG: DnaD domain protein [Oscillospiraceae bacterium]|nr:DnaD domain protein [Oscillospiraceae bacterium]